MSGYQFIHVNAYSSVQKVARTRKGRADSGRVKWAASDVLNEACRETSASGHVENPLPPTWLHGNRVEVEQAGKAWLAGTKVGTRKARSDSPWMAAGVISLPNDRRAEWDQFRDQAVSWLIGKYGDRLRGVVEHLDEKHPHLHYYAVPRPGEQFGAVHEGYAAQAAARARGDRKVGTAYVQAMRGLQDEFQQGIGWMWQLTRSGAKQERLTRAEWKAKQAEADALAATEAAGKLRQEAANLVAQATHTKQEAQAEAARLLELASEAAESTRARARRDAGVILAEAAAKACQMVEAETKRIRSKAASYFKTFRNKKSAELERRSKAVEAEEQRVKELAKLVEQRAAEAAETEQALYSSEGMAQLTSLKRALEKASNELAMRLPGEAVKTVSKAAELPILKVRTGSPQR